ncbi:hypothetical protein K438DRAFT_1770595 [Mycena galopus ATCC 62051]|nr:hypothetical protein K438DRAFT_1770595 [Mycena galopus ATCC 62051]
MHGCVALVAFAVTFTRYTWDVPSALCSDVKVQSGRGGAVRSPLPLFSSWLAPCVMARCTRSGAQFSAWELDLLEPLSDPLAPVQVFRARVSLEPRLLEAIASAEARATAMDALEHAHDGSEGDDSEWEDEDVVSSRPPTPLARPPTPLPPPLYSRSPSPLSDPPPSPHAQATRLSRLAPDGSATKPAARKRVGSESAGWGWTGPRASKKARLSREHIRRLRELLAEDWELVEWNGRDPKLILDADGRIVAVLLGRPEAADWDQVIAEMERVFEGVRLRGVARGVFKPKARRHRRGDFYVLKGGVTRGPDKRSPQSQPELNWPFANSIFPTATFNLGPDVVTPEHLDMLNLAQGMCAVTSGGRFNHKTGGHIYMDHLKLICEFPSGSTYAAGALFRWAAYGYQSATSLGAGRKQEIDGERATVGLLSMVQELERDRQEVFGN